MKKATFFFFLSFIVYFSHGQTGIGTTSPNANSVLEVSSDNKGILIPRVALDVGRNSPSPLSAHVAGMIIYNTASTTGTPATNSVTPGFYFNDGSQWIRVANASEGDPTNDSWIDDNANTMVKLGTLSNGTTSRPEGAAFVAKDNGRVGIGTTNPIATLHVNDGNFRLENHDNWNAYKGVTYSNNKYPQLFLYQARGTKASPTYPQNTTTLGVFKAANAVDSTGGAGFRVVSTEQQSATSHGTAIAYFTTANGSGANMDRLLIDHNGNVKIAANVDALNAGAARPGARLVVDGYTRLGTADVTADALTTASDRSGMIRYNNTLNALQYHNTTQWVTPDISNDAWVNDYTDDSNTANDLVKLGTKSDGTSARPAGTEFVVRDDGNTGIGTATPQEKLHVNGSMQITNELNVGGTATTAGSAGTAGQILTSNGDNVAPTWKSAATVPGTIAKAVYVQGTAPATTTSFGASGTPIVVPGVTYTHTVPAGSSQTLLFTVTGYAVRSVTTFGEATQGVFTLLQDGVKITSAYAASGDFGSLENVPVSVTLMKSVTLSPGTYTFIVRYKAWSGNQTVNYLPSNYAGYDGDSEAMLTKMQVLVYNN